MLLMMGFLTLTSDPAAAQPINNTCGQNQASFTIPPGGGTVTQSSGSWNNDGSPCSAIGGGGNAADVYYYWVPNSSGPWLLSLCSTTPLFDSVLSIHTFPCPATQGNSVACNDNGGSGTGCGSQLSQIDSVTLNAGSSYIIRVANRMGNSSHTFLTSSPRISQGAPETRRSMPQSGDYLVIIFFRASSRFL